MEEPTHLKLVVSNKEPQVRKRKAYWWRRLHPCRAIQVPVAAITFILFVLAMLLDTFKYWHASSNLFALSTFGMLAFWFLEYMHHKDQQDEADTDD